MQTLNPKDLMQKKIVILILVEETLINVSD